MNRYAIGVNQDATGGLTVAKCLKPVCPGGVPSSPLGVPFIPRCRPDSPRCRPGYPRFAPDHPGLSRCYHGLLRCRPGFTRFLTSLTVRPGRIKHFNTNVNDPRFALVYPGSSRFATVALLFRFVMVHPGLLNTGRTGELNRDIKNIAKQVYLHYLYIYKYELEFDHQDVNATKYCVIF